MSYIKIFEMKAGGVGVSIHELQNWLRDPHTVKLSDHYKNLACRYALMYSHKTEMPIGRPLANFMLWFNKNHPNMNWFPDEMINYWYYY